MGENEDTKTRDAKEPSENERGLRGLLGMTLSLLASNGCSNAHTLNVVSALTVASCDKYPIRKTGSGLL